MSRNCILRKIKAHVIFIADKDLSAQGLRDAQRKAEDLRAQVIKNQASFPDLAKANSDDVMTKRIGGELGVGMFGTGGGWLASRRARH